MLGKRLEAFHRSLLERVDPAKAQILVRSEAALAESGLADNALHAGDLAPDFDLPDQNGRPIRLSERLRQRGPAVLMFFRGGWCPYCTITLRAWQDRLRELRAAGGQVLAISPQRIPACTETAARDMLDFTVLSDHGNVVAGQFRVVYELDPDLRPFYRKLGHDLPVVNGTSDWTLPLPATFIIRQDRRIAHAHVEPSVYKRMEPSDALRILRELQAESQAAAKMPAEAVHSPA
jgi:peroxiredoxin